MNVPWCVFFVWGEVQDWLWWCLRGHIANFAYSTKTSSKTDLLLLKSTARKPLWRSKYICWWIDGAPAQWLLNLERTLWVVLLTKEIRQTRRFGEHQISHCMCTGCSKISTTNLSSISSHTHRIHIWYTSSARTSRGRKFQRKTPISQRKNLPIECAQGDRPARCPNHFFAVNEPSAVPWWWCDLFWCHEVACGVRWSNVLGCEVTWGELLWLVATWHVMSRHVTWCPGHVIWCDVIACVVSCHVMQCDVMWCALMWRAVICCALQWDGMLWG